MFAHAKHHYAPQLPKNRLPQPGPEQGLLLHQHRRPGGRHGRGDAHWPVGVRRNEFQQIFRKLRPHRAGDDVPDVQRPTRAAAGTAPGVGRRTSKQLLGFRRGIYLYLAPDAPHRERRKEIFSNGHLHQSSVHQRLFAANAARHPGRTARCVFHHAVGFGGAGPLRHGRPGRQNRRDGQCQQLNRHGCVWGFSR